MEASQTPREGSPAVAVLLVQNHSSNRKRKHASMTGTATASPAPSDRGGTPMPNDNVVIARNSNLSHRQVLDVSRHPLFVPITPGSPYCTTEPLCINRLNFRYTPAGLTGQDAANPFRTLESNPKSFRISWEDRSPFVKVMTDGLGLKGEKGFRSARCNAPVREGKWYMEVKIEQGGDSGPSDGQHREGSHVRLGWARREAPLNGPVGLDGYSYGYRDKTGEKVHLSRPRPYAKPYQPGDVVGMYISLPSPRRQPNKKDPYDPAHIRRERIAIEYKGQEYFESFEYSQSKEMLALMEANDRRKASSSTPAPPPTKKSATVKNLPSTSRGAKPGLPETTPMRPLPTLGPESCIAFFVNGECQGIAFRDLFDYLPLRTPPNKAHEKKRTHKDGLREHKENPFDDGSLGYYPMISLFNGAEVKLNPGPNFDFPPPPDIDAVLVNGPSGLDVKPSLDGTQKWRPLCDRYKEYIAEQTELDQLEEREAKKPKLGKQVEEPPAKEEKEAPVEKEEKPAKPSKKTDTKGLTDQEKLEIHRAKRRAQAARRRERARLAKEAEEARTREQVVTVRRKVAQTSRAASMSVDADADPEPEPEPEPDVEPDLGADTDADAELAQLVDDTTNAPSRDTHFSPTPTAGSVGDVQSYWTGVVNDNSEYNTEYEDGMDGEQRDADDQGADSEMGIDEELAQLT